MADPRSDPLAPSCTDVPFVDAVSAISPYWRPSINTLANRLSPSNDVSCGSPFTTLAWKRPVPVITPPVPFRSDCTSGNVPKSSPPNWNAAVTVPFFQSAGRCEYVPETVTRAAPRCARLSR